MTKCALPIYPDEMCAVTPLTYHPKQNELIFFRGKLDLLFDVLFLLFDFSGHAGLKFRTSKCQYRRDLSVSNVSAQNDAWRPKKRQTPETIFFEIQLFCYFDISSSSNFFCNWDIRTCGIEVPLGTQYESDLQTGPCWHKK